MLGWSKLYSILSQLITLFLNKRYTMKKIDQYAPLHLLIVFLILGLVSFYLNMYVFGHATVHSPHASFVNSYSIIPFAGLAFYGVFLYLMYRWWQHRSSYAPYFMFILSWMYLIDLYKLFACNTTLFGVEPPVSVVHTDQVFGTEAYVRFAIIAVLNLALIALAIKLWVDRKILVFIQVNHPQRKMKYFYYAISLFLLIISLFIMMYVYENFDDEANHRIAKFGDTIAPLAFMVLLHVVYLWIIYRSMQITDGTWTFDIFCYIAFYIPLMGAMILGNTALHVASSPWTADTYEAYEDGIKPYKYGAFFIYSIAMFIFMIWSRKKHMAKHSQ